MCGQQKSAVSGSLPRRRFSVVDQSEHSAAGAVMFMLHLGEILEEWTHKRSVADLASAMSLRVDSVWRQVNGAEVLTKITDVKPGNRIVIRAPRALI